jgi:XTP/dITP diphosphohydrolase
MTDTASKPVTLLLATRNQGKLAEFKGLLSGVGFKFVSPDDLKNVADVAETGRTFAENARLKASGYAQQTSLLSLADDSGLEVEALGGRPGVLSARYGGEGTSFGEKITLLLGELETTDDPERRARFVCSLAIADPAGKIIFTADGICSGRIAFEPRGTGGFGYDPIFIPDGYDETFGELSSGVKQEISHRARAFRQIIPFLRGFIAILT